MAIYLSQPLRKSLSRERRNPVFCSLFLTLWITLSSASWLGNNLFTDHCRLHKKDSCAGAIGQLWA